MKRVYWNALIVLLGFAVGPAQAQVVQNPLLVGNQMAFNALDLYDGNTGTYVRPFAGNGTGPPGAYFFTYGPNGNVFVNLNANPSPVLQYNGITGNFVSTFVASSGSTYTFGPDGNFYRIEGLGGSQTVRRYNGSSGQLIDTFVSSNLLGGSRMRFGPGGDLFIGDGPSIKRFSGASGAFLGNFTQPGAGGTGSALDFLFTADGRLVLTDAGAPNSVLQFDSSTGGFIGTLVQGNGLDAPFGITIGPDGNLYVASTFGDTIKRFDLMTGAFLGDLVTTTVHAAPSFIAFSPNPIPEPASCILMSIVVGVCTCRRASKCLAMSLFSRSK